MVKPKIEAQFQTGDTSKGNPFQGKDIEKAIEFDAFDARVSTVLDEGDYPTFLQGYRSEARKVVRYLPKLERNQIALDLGSGTGNSTLELVLKTPDARVIGIEQGKGMVYVARYKFHQLENEANFLNVTEDEAVKEYWETMRRETTPYKNQVSFVVGDMTTLEDFDEDSIDAMMANQAVHWAAQGEILEDKRQNLLRMFTRVRKVLKPGARFVWNSASHFIEDIDDGTHPAYPTEKFGFRYNDFMACVMEEVAKEHAVGDYSKKSKPIYTIPEIIDLTRQAGLVTSLVGTQLFRFDLQNMLTMHIPTFAVELMYEKMESKEKEERVRAKKGDIDISSLEESEIREICQQSVREIADKAIGRAMVRPNRLKDFNHKYDIIPIFVSTK